MSRNVLCFILILWVAGGCISRGESQLSKALTLAVKERKISQKKLENILIEYDKIRDDDKKKAQEYVELVLSAIEMGGDSSHIDAVRRQVLRKPSKAKV